MGPGFDCLGLAVDLWGRITLSLDKGKAADDPMVAMARTAARRLFEKIGRSSGDVHARYEGDVPLARGLGASAVARVGGLVAANRLAGNPLDRDELLRLATDLENHADNAAPAIFGGMQVSVVDDSGTVLHTSAPLPDGLHTVLLVPELRIATKDARRVLPRTLSREDAVFNAARTALLVAAMARGRFDLLDTATQDRIHQPYRSKIYPAMTPIFDAARNAGAHAVYLSGSGSTICALATASMDEIASSMLAAAEKSGLKARIVITRPSDTGAEVVSEA